MELNVIRKMIRSIYWNDNSPCGCSSGGIIPLSIGCGCSSALGWTCWTSGSIAVNIVFMSELNCFVAIRTSADLSLIVGFALLLALFCGLISGAFFCSLFGEERVRTWTLVSSFEGVPVGMAIRLSFSSTFFSLRTGDSGGTAVVLWGVSGTGGVKPTRGCGVMLLSKPIGLS